MLQQRADTSVRVVRTVALDRLFRKCIRPLLGLLLISQQQPAGLHLASWRTAFKFLTAGLTIKEAQLQ